MRTPVKFALCAAVFLKLALCSEAALVAPTPVQKIHAWSNQAAATTAFVLKNTGPTAVTVKNIKPSCDCTEATLEHRTIAPGAEEVLNVTYKVRAQAGRRVRTIAIGTEPEQGPPLELRLEVEVAEAVSVVPAVLRWSEHQSRDEKSAIIEVNAMVDIKQVEIASVSSDFTAHVTPVQSPDGKKIYQLTVKPLQADAKGVGAVSLAFKGTAPNSEWIVKSVALFAR